MPEATNSKTVAWTLEIVPSHAENIHVFEGLVREIFVTMIPGTDHNDIIKALAAVQAGGFEPVPHLTARAFADETALAGFCDGMRENGIKKALVIAGGLSTPEGPFADSLAVLKSNAFHNSGVTNIALAGHPEGNPADPDSMASLLAKWHYIQEQGWQAEIVTQWSFSPDKVSRYIEQLREAGITCPIRIGVAGPASLKTLLKYAKICGVTAAAGVLKKQGFSLGRLLVSNDPKGFVNKVTGTEYFHLYPFGGLEKCAKWLTENAPPR